MYGKGGKQAYGWADPYGAPKGGKKGGEEWMFVPEAKGGKNGKKGGEEWVYIPPAPQPEGSWVFVPAGGSPKGAYGGWDGGYKGKDAWGADPWAAYPPMAKGYGKGAPSGGKGLKGIPQKKVDCRKMFVGGLPRGMSEDKVAEHFSQFGPIEEVKMMVHPTDGESRGYCFVTFVESASADAVYAQYDSNILEGGWVDCKPSDGGKSVKAGDWICPGCGDLVFAFRDTCKMCGTSSHGAAPALAGAEGKGGKSNKPGDWTCPNCGDLVFASKPACRMCGTPKPAAGGGGKGKGAFGKPY